jgi:alpha-beta hydrolase superfamily lysophospholipase
MEKARVLGRWLRRVVSALVLVLATLVLAQAFDARSLPDLKPWHRVVPRGEVRAAEMDRMSLREYLRREDRLFADQRARIDARLPPQDRTPGNRYFPGSPLHSGRFGRDWNRTFELEPQEIRGGVLLVHGLTDSPYSLRHVARTFQEQGFYALALRMPGHGTVPAALSETDWEDWRAAVRLGARHVQGRIGERDPLVLVGYSNGAALVIEHSLAALEREDLPRADGIVLLSPMIGVHPLAALARISGTLGALPYFEKSRWQDVMPEYIPFKYNSFPIHAAAQSHRLTSTVQTDLRRAADSGRLAGLPPLLTFQSLVDSTVSTPDLLGKLYAPLPANGSELVLFDLNRTATVRPFLKAAHDTTIDALLRNPDRRYRLTWVTNTSDETLGVEERTALRGDTAARVRPLGLTWPPQVYSLSHVALPFPTGDALYGSEPDPGEDYGLHLGLLSPRGEKAILSVPMDNFMRLYSNPFYPYLEERIRGWIPGISKIPARR